MKEKIKEEVVEEIFDDKVRKWGGAIDLAISKTAQAIFDDLDKLIPQELLEDGAIEEDFEELKKKWCEK